MTPGPVAPVFDRPSPLQRVLRAREQRHALEQEAASAWTPGQVFGELLRYLDHVEAFNDTTLNCRTARQQLERRTNLLQLTVDRSVEADIVDAQIFDGLFAVLAHLDEILVNPFALFSTGAAAARELVRLEIRFLATSPGEE